jgi:tetraacyldisaccharide 4'-kinase
LSGKRVLAFAGIGDPARFFTTLRRNGVNVADEKAFDDHHPFTVGDIEQLVAVAQAKSLTLVTTEKDMARLRSDAQLASRVKDVVAFAVSLDFSDDAMFRRFVAERLVKARLK